MKVLVSAFVLASLALGPAAIVGAEDPSKAPGSAEAHVPARPTPEAGRLIAQGCHDGFLFFISFGSSSFGVWDGPECEGETITFTFV
ncbi:hypothetical protein ACE2AJ_13510 [Aquihabitans daechungensis]|uniref:hypothetical protein n=1 Tax=Aquihabitans daechungensis TaxID=1052257 RepID=UPI003BA062F0